jgi:hypothetical protein
MRVRSIAMMTALVGSLAFAPAVTSDVGDADGTGSDNFTLSQNVPHSFGGRGSDIEFATFTFDTAEDAATAGYSNPATDADPATDGIQKDIALAGTTGTKFYLYDVTTPDDVYETAAYDCPANQGDTQVFHRGDKTYTTYTVEDGSSALSGTEQCGVDAGLVQGSGNEGGDYTGTLIIEITDPFAPKAVAFIEVDEGSHNGTVHPSGNYFYNSNSSLITEMVLEDQPGIEYFDISDFDEIKRLGKLYLPQVPLSLGNESHDITFADDGDRAYSAALAQGVIIDTSDPANPTIISTFVDPTIQVWHQSDPIDIDGRRFLFIEDEFAGAIGSGQCPNGGVHVYEATPGTPTETVPVKVGYWNIDEVRVMASEGGDTPINPSCTAHVFRLHPEANIATISYYNGGVRILDLNGMQGVALGGVSGGVTLDANGYGQDPIVQIGFRRFEDSNSWSAKTPRIPLDADGNVSDFQVFSNGGRGIDSLAFDADNTAAAEMAATQGRWFSPAEALDALGTGFTFAEIQAGLKPYACLLQ